MSEEKNAKNAAAAGVKNGNAWFKGLKAEFNKIIWENKENVTKQTIAVVAVSVVLGIIIAVLDMILQYGVDFIVGL
ncbi:MAG: preprotein translocase subunit SecE [Lachnospiraceae bacterium]|nr:preprotein translocase subunit SecE [Lachnospiraceae bacterium]